MPRRRFKAYWLFPISLVLLLLPHSWGQPAKLTVLKALVPLHSLASGLSSTFERMFTSPHEPNPETIEEIRRQNAFLADRNKKLEDENRELRQKLSSLSEFKDVQRDRSNFTMIFADVVIPTDTSDWRRGLVVAAGKSDGVEPGLPVVWENHLIGRISDVGPSLSRVMLVTDPHFRVGAVPLSTYSKDQFQVNDLNVGIVQGTSSYLAEMNWLVRESEVHEGWTVVTIADPDHYLPKGLIIGRVESLDLGKGTFTRVLVRPALNYRNLEHVMIRKPK